MRPAPLTSCTAVVDGAGSPFMSGAALPAALGSHSIAVTATEADAATAAATATYVIAGAPTAQIGSPANGQTNAVGRSVPTTFSCADGTDGLGISVCSDSNGASGGTGQLDTAATGTHTYTVTATSHDGLTGSHSITYNVEDPPIAQISTPGTGGVYASGQFVQSRAAAQALPAPLTDAAGSRGGAAADGYEIIPPHWPPVMPST